MWLVVRLLEDGTELLPFLRFGSPFVRVEGTASLLHIVELGSLISLTARPRKKYATSRIS